MNQVTEEIANRVFGMAVNTAKVPMEMRSPYELNISDAVSLLEEGEWHAVAVASLRALKYAVGIHGKPYQDAFRIIYGDPKPSEPHFVNQVTDMGVTRPLSRAVRCF